MAVESYQRAMRRLREHRRKRGTAAGMRTRGLELQTWIQWDDVWGRLDTLRIWMPGGLFMDRCALYATAFFGKDWIRALTEYEPWPESPSRRCRPRWVIYALPMDGGALHPNPRRPCFSRPNYVLWYDVTALGRGIGTDGGRASYCGRELLVTSEG